MYEFPFQNIDQDELIDFFNYDQHDLNISQTTRDSLTFPINSINFNYIEEVDEIFEEQSDFDPDINLPMGIDNKCAYIEIKALETELSNNLNNDFGLLEMNIRSLIKNFTPLQLLIESLREKLHFILLVETWLNATSVDHYGLEGFRCIKQSIKESTSQSL